MATWSPEVGKVPHDPLFASPWLKWGRAAVHAQALHADLERTIALDNPDHPTLVVRTEYQPKRHGFAVIIDDIDPMPPRLGLVLGDLVNNLRSALDHLAWAIVERGQTPPDRLSDWHQRNIYFPLCETPAELTKKLPAKLPGATHADITRVRRYQPYKHRAWRYALPLLAEINADDKHREIQPLWAAPMAGTIEVTHQRDCVIHERNTTMSGQILKVNTELGLIRARKVGKQPYIEVVPHLACEPALESGFLLREWMRIALWWVQWLLYEFSEMPAEIENLGIDGESVRTIYEGPRRPS